MPSDVDRGFVAAGAGACAAAVPQSARQAAADRDVRIAFIIRISRRGWRPRLGFVAAGGAVE
jgi:ABC-type sugar transport system substrate-binding protein